MQHNKISLNIYIIIIIIMDTEINISKWYILRICFYLAHKNKFGIPKTEYTFISLDIIYQINDQIRIRIGHLFFPTS